MVKKRKINSAHSATLLQYFAKNESEEPFPASKKARQSSAAIKLEEEEKKPVTTIKSVRETIVIDLDDEDERILIDVTSSDDSDEEVVAQTVSLATGKGEPYNSRPKRDLRSCNRPSLPFVLESSDVYSANSESDTMLADTVSTSGDSTVVDSIFESESTASTASTLECDIYADDEKIEDYLSELDAEEVNSPSCPICGTILKDMRHEERQGHVNTCLDTSAVEDRSSTPGSSRRISPPEPLELETSKKSAFSFIMSGKAERERAVWAEAQKNEDRDFRPTKNNRRQAPFYKVLSGMPIAVDAFRYGFIPGITAYFLTHAHSDHYTNLSSNWKGLPIYCSETTANLIVHMLSVDRKWVRPLPMNIPVVIPDTGGVQVTLIDANHCPGSCIFLFEGPQTVNAGDSNYKSQFVGSKRIFRYLHCGDFRACPQQALHPQIKCRKIDIVYLDTTYLNPKYCFPPQPLVIEACAELARRIVRRESTSEDNQFSSASDAFTKWTLDDKRKGKQKDTNHGDTLVVIGTYSIGKERIVKAVANALSTKVYCDNRKAAILRCQDDPELFTLLTNDPLEAGVHIVPLAQVASDRFKEYMARWKDRWTRAVAFRPTGWTYAPPAGSDTMPPITAVVAKAQSRKFSYSDLKPARNSTPTHMQYGVPYSEHSSFAELTCFMLGVDCTKVIPTVNIGNAVGRAKMQKWIEKWDTERRRRQEARESGIIRFRSLEFW